jgi:hypothetical protein
MPANQPYRGFRFAALAVILLLSFAPHPTVAMENAPAYYGRCANGIPSDPNFFPIAVWLQSPANATAYKTNAAINLFIGLWAGPTDSQLLTLKSAGMPVLCDQSTTGLAHVVDKTIMGWIQSDEPDNAQSDGHGGYGPPVVTNTIVAIYNTLKSNDVTRPVYLNLGQGVAWDGYTGRGVRTGHPEDYYGYVKGCDIASFDIYPVNSTRAEVSGKLWYVPQGIDRLRTYTGDAKPVWCWIECTQFNTNSAAKPTPQQVRSEVWMALIHGANGIGYFCHMLTPFDETGLLHDATMLSAVKALNLQIQSLAPVLNSTTITNLVTVTSTNAAVPIDILVKQSGSSTYVFAAAMRDGITTGTFTFPFGAIANVLGEGRQIAISNGTFSDSFATNAVHLYQIDSIGDSVGDGIPDWWRQQYFGGTGTNTNSVSCATCDADGTGQNNRFKYLAGLNPTNPASVFVMGVTIATNLPTWFTVNFSPASAGRNYAPEFSTNLTPGGWLPLIGSIGPLINGNQRTITDTNAVEAQKFYRIHLSFP